MIKARNLELNYGESKILDIKNLQIDTSKITALTGSNGSGKSTLLRVISFLQRPSRGEVEIWGCAKPNLEILRRISILFSEPALLKRSVRENFRFALKSRGLEREFNSRVGEALELTGLDESFLSKRHFELSSGQTQRTAFALVLALRSRLYLLDEPTNSVDLATSKLFGKAVEFMRDQYKSGFIIASHDEKWLSAVAQESVFLHRGCVSEFELKNVFNVQNKALKFSENLTLALPENLASASKIAINPSGVKISLTPFDGCSEGVLHSVSLAYEGRILIKIKIGDFLIKCVRNLDEKQKFCTGERAFFEIPPSALLSLE